jgi:hypothetical protein
MVRVALWALRIYLLILLALIGLKFARVFSHSRMEGKPPATAVAKPDEATKTAP